MTDPAPDSMPRTLALVRCAQGGDLDAYDRIFEEYYDRVLAVVRRRMGRGLRINLESRDILHEAMVEAIRSFSQFEARSEHALLAWFARIVENRIRNTVEFQRAAKRDRANEVVLDHLRSTAASLGPAPEPADARTLPFESLARKERAGIVAECLAELPEDRRRVVELKNKERLSWEDVARELGSGTPQAARMLYARALVDLKEMVLRRMGSD